MRIVTNEALVKRNKKTAQYLFFLSLLLLFAGFIAVNAPLFADVPADLESITTLLLPSIILPVAFITTIFSVRMTNLWVRQPRPERVFSENLKGLGSNAVLYSYYHFPARHVLICPQGVFAIVTRFQDGKFEVEGQRWSTKRSLFGLLFAIFRMDGIGNPSVDAQLAAEHVQSQLASIAPDIKVQPLVVFIDPRARLTITNPTVPVLHGFTRIAPSLQDYLKSIPKPARRTLTNEQIAAFEAATVK